MSAGVIKKSLRFSFIEGVFASIMTGFSETFITPYALAMNAGAGLIGVLAAIPNLAGALIQVKGPELLEILGSRKKLMTWSVLLQTLMWLPILLIPYLFKGHQAVFLIIFYTIFTSFGALSISPWSSMMSDYVPETERGKIFGLRNRICGVVNVACMLAAGLILNAAKDLQLSAMIGFTAIFLIAFAARFLSWRTLCKMGEIPLAMKAEHRFTMKDFLKRLTRTNFGRFVIFAAAINFAVFMSGPFFAVYMLKDLNFSYLTYTVITMTSTLTIFFMMTLWGAHADHVGNRRVLRLTSYFLPFIPMLWLVSHNIPYLIAIQFFGGFFWAGFNLSTANFIYDAVTPEKRTRCIAYFNVVNGVAMFAGSLTGGILANSLPPIFGCRLLSIFLLSGLIRLAALPLCSYIREVRPVKNVSSMELFYSVVTGRSPASVYSGRSI